MFDKLKDLGGLMQQAQAMQQKVQELQAELERLEIVGSSGAGLVKVTVNGKNETRRVEIDASLFKPDDKGVVEGDVSAIRSSTAPSSGLNSEASISTRRVSFLPLTVTLTRPAPELPTISRRSTRPASSCTFCCMAWACCIRPPRSLSLSNIRTPNSGMSASAGYYSAGGGSSAGRTATSPRPCAAPSPA